MDTSSSSKVTVEYHDPSGVFPLISRDIAARLPLRNLNWQSQNRPLRQIKSLHLEFVPDNITKSSLRPPAPRIDSEGTTSLDIVRSGIDQRRNAAKERRHQIPGLETSPYLKIYVLRCDDKDTYKTSERPKLREWIKENASTQKKGKGGNHDATEWLILHVVIPDTLAASEPRWREASAKDSEELKERPKQGAKWPGKSTRTVFDKLRADFNESGKSGQDRVAQIRIPKDQLPPDLLPSPAVAETLEETWDEREKAWNDLMTKFKTLILIPFDQRVRQYEADIAEQDVRRSLPGFNFCTFFIHKEGLAKALESIGLVEDALVIYDELSLGFETVLRDIANGRAEGTATMFAPYTVDIIERITGPKQSRPNGVNADDRMSHQDDDEVDSLERQYRERIVRSQISVFDFFCYLFSRQKALILRLANAKSARTKLGSSTKDGNEDLIYISEVCWRSTSFVHNVVRKLRQDLFVYRTQAQTSTSLSENDIDSLVCSWTYSLAGQVLDETVASALEPSSEPEKHEQMPNGTSTGHARSESSSLPQRTTSLPVRQSRVSELRGRTSMQSTSDSDLINPTSSSGSDDRRVNAALPGMPELVTYRAELVMIQRKMLEQLAKQRGWLAGWAMVRESKTSRMEDVELNGDSHEPMKPSLSSLLSPTVALALASERDFHEAYESLSDQAMRCYVTSTQTKSAEAIMGDLAILKYQQGDFGYATSYFQHVLPLYAADGWSLMEAEALNMHAKSLKELDRNEEYVKTLLDLLAKVCGKRKERKVPRMRFEVVDDEVLDVEGILPELVAFSDQLDDEITSSAEQFFNDIRLDRQVIHHKGKDGFALRFGVRHLLSDELALDQISARLVHVDYPSQDIWVSSASAANLVPGQNEFVLESTVVTSGAYLVDKIVLRAKKLMFQYEMLQRAEEGHDSLDITGAVKKNQGAGAHKKPWMLLYPAQHAFDADMRLAKNIHIDRARYLEVTLDSGWNEVGGLNLKLKPATAGLRLHLADAIFTDIAGRSDEESSAGQINLGKLGAYSSAVVKVPYSLEQDGYEILIHLEANYQTCNGFFTFLISTRLPIQLPLDVEVHDIFHLQALFSSFTVRTTDRAPLSMSQAQLKSSAVYEVEAPPMLPLPMTIFERQPVKLVYKITRNEVRSINKEEAALALSVHYHSMEEVLVSILVKRFAYAFEQSQFASLSRLLIPLLSPRLKSFWSIGDIEIAALLDQAKVPSLSEIGWDEITSTLPISTQKPLTDWLSSWHESNAHIELGQERMPEELERSITICVDIPNVDFVHKASLSFLNPAERSEQGLQILVLGRPMKTLLKLANTRAWSAKSLFHSNRDSNKDEEQPINFVFDIQADADSWLVGGPRRAHFTVKEGVEQTFELLLIPLKLGIYSLPQVDVRAVQAIDNSGAQDKESAISCETHNESAGQVVQVIRDLRTARVHIPESSAAARPPSRPNTAKEAG